MIRTHTIPKDNKFLIELPIEYIGKRIEVIAFMMDEVEIDSSSDDTVLTHIISEDVLAKDWNREIEEEVWKDL